MSSISEGIAKAIVKGNGVYTCPETGESDPQVFAVFTIKNSYFGHIHHVVAYREQDFYAYAKDHEVEKILWAKDERLYITGPSWSPK